VLVVHGVWIAGESAPGRLALWAEDPALPLTTSSRARRRPHPFAVPAGALAAALTGSSDDVRDALAKTAETELTLHLPGTAKGPLPSPEAGSEAPGRGLRLAAWETPALVLPGEQALTALGALAEPDPDGPWMAAASLRYLCVLAGHACDLARRGRMLPQLVMESGTPAGRWRPVLTGADAASYRDFAVAMPPVCRSAGPLLEPAGSGPAGAGVDGSAPSGSVGRTLRDALEVLVDTAARALLPERMLLGLRPGPKTAKMSSSRRTARASLAASTSRSRVAG